jgi:hypothetical protein
VRCATNVDHHRRVQSPQSVLLPQCCRVSPQCSSRSNGSVPKDPPIKAPAGRGGGCVATHAAGSAAGAVGAPGPRRTKRIPRCPAAAAAAGCENGRESQGLSTAVQPVDAHSRIYSRSNKVTRVSRSARGPPGISGAPPPPFPASVSLPQNKACITRARRHRARSEKPVSFPLCVSCS